MFSVLVLCKQKRNTFVTLSQHTFINSEPHTINITILTGVMEMTMGILEIYTSGYGVSVFTRKPIKKLSEPI